MLFLDEIDSITQKRENASKDMERRIVSQLLTCMDGELLPTALRSKAAKVMFSQACVILFTGGGMHLHRCSMDTPPPVDAPPPHIPPHWMHPPYSPPLMQHGCTPPPLQHGCTPSPRDGHCRGRYASYWNAFLYFIFLCKNFICSNHGYVTKDAAI